MKTSTAKTAEHPAPKATDALVNIVDQAIAFRFPETVPTLAAIVRLVGSASRVLGIRDLDERLSVENAATMVLAKNRKLIA